MSIRVEAIGTDRVIATFDGYPSRIHSAVVRGITKLGNMMLGFDIANLSGAVLKRQTGQLAGAQNLQIDTTDTTATASVGFNSATTPWGKWHEEGVPHDWLIEAKRARALRFEWNGEIVFRKKVVHPPLPERSFLRAALRQTQPQIEPVMTGEIAAELRK